MKPRKQTLAWALVALGLQPAVAGAAEKAEPPPTVVAQRGLLRIVVHTVGIVVPVAEVPISARAAGEILSIPVELGQAVKKGQNLLEIESGAQTRAVEHARVELLEAQAQLRIAQIRLALALREHKPPPGGARKAIEAAEAALTEARAELERVVQRQKNNQATEKDVREAERKRDEALNRRDLLREQMSQATATSYALELQRQEVLLREAATSRTKVALENARAELSKTSLIAPLDGVITECLVKRGQVIAPASVEAGMHVMTVSDFSKIAVLAEIEENQSRDVQPNLAANVVLPAFAERRFQGRIVSISPRGQSRSGKTVFPIRIELEGDPGDAARIGLTANVEIVAIEKPDALLLETRAVRWSGNEPYVVVLEKGQPKERKIRIGRSDGARVEVTEGLHEGDQIVLPEAPPPPSAPTPPKK